MNKKHKTEAGRAFHQEMEGGDSRDDASLQVLGVIFDKLPPEFKAKITQGVSSNGPVPPGAQTPRMQ